MKSSTKRQKILSVLTCWLHAWALGQQDWWCLSSFHAQRLSPWLPEGCGMPSLRQFGEINKILWRLKGKQSKNSFNVFVVSKSRLISLYMIDMMRSRSTCQCHRNAITIFVGLFFHCLPAKSQTISPASKDPRHLRESPNVWRGFCC